MRSWYRTIREDELKDGSIRKVYHLVFETDDKNIVEKVEQFFCDVMDAKTENSSEKPNNFDKDINARSNCEPQTCSVNGRPYTDCCNCEHFKCTADEPQTDKEIILDPSFAELSDEQFVEAMKLIVPQTDCSWK